MSRRTVLTAGGLFLILAIVGAAGFGAWALLSGTSPTGGDGGGGPGLAGGGVPGAPAVVDGLPVVSVSDFLARQVGTSADQPFAVAGWYSAEPPHSCPAGPIDPVTGQIREATPLETYCHTDEEILDGLPEPVADVSQTSNSMTVSRHDLRGPWFQPIFAYPFGGPGVTPTVINKPWLPTPVVLVGHVADPRATKCPPDQVAACAARFVVDHVAWQTRGALGPSVVADPGSGLTPKLTAAQVRAIVNTRFAGPNTFLGLAAVGRADFTRYEPLMPVDVVDGPIVWEVRLLFQGDGRSRLVTALVSDETGTVAWTTLLSPGQSDPGPS